MPDPDTVTVKVLKPFADGGGAYAQMMHPGATLTCLRSRAAELAANGLTTKPGAAAAPALPNDELAKPRGRR